MNDSSNDRLNFRRFAQNGRSGRPLVLVPHPRHHGARRPRRRGRRAPPPAGAQTRRRATGTTRFCPARAAPRGDGPAAAPQARHVPRSPSPRTHKSHLASFSPPRRAAPRLTPSDYDPPPRPGYADGGVAVRGRGVPARRAAVAYRPRGARRAPDAAGRLGGRPRAVAGGDVGVSATPGAGVTVEVLRSRPVRRVRDPPVRLPRLDLDDPALRPPYLLRLATADARDARPRRPRPAARRRPCRRRRRRDRRRPSALGADASSRTPSRAAADHLPPPLDPERRAMLNSQDMDAWQLHEERVGDAGVFLVDRETDVAYHPLSHPGEWPRVAGVKQRADGAGGGGASSRLVATPGPGERPNEDLFERLDQFLRVRRKRLADVFRSYDVDGDGALSAAELNALLLDVVPGVTPSQERYFATMLGLGTLPGDGDGTRSSRGSIGDTLAERLTFDAFVDSIREARDAGLAVVAHRDDEVPPALAALHAFMRANEVDARQVFDAVDTDGSGRLDVEELRLMVAQLNPSVTPPRRSSSSRGSSPSTSRARLARVQGPPQRPQAPPVVSCPCPRIASRKAKTARRAMRTEKHPPPRPGAAGKTLSPGGPTDRPLRRARGGRAPGPRERRLVRRPTPRPRRTDPKQNQARPTRRGSPRSGSRISSWAARRSCSTDTTGGCTLAPTRPPPTAGGRCSSASSATARWFDPTARRRSGSSRAWTRTGNRAAPGSRTCSRRSTATARRRSTTEASDFVRALVPTRARATWRTGALLDVDCDGEVTYEELADDRGGGEGRGGRLRARARAQPGASRS